MLLLGSCLFWQVYVKMPSLVATYMIFNFVICSKQLLNKEKFTCFYLLRYDLQLLSVDEPVGGMKEGLQQIMDKSPDIMAVFVGGRCQDPGHGDVQPTQHTDNGWQLYITCVKRLHRELLDPFFIVRPTKIRNSLWLSNVFFLFYPESWRS